MKDTIRERVLLLLTIGVICFAAGYYVGNGNTKEISAGSGVLEVVSLGKDDVPVVITPSPSPIPSGGIININTASAEELDLLPGIGPDTARRILEYRDLNGPFLRTEDIMEVKGIGESTYDKIKEYITVN